jgi:transcriptional regulator with XRE-family HTH domain
MVDGTRVEHWRRTRGMTQGELGKAAGMTHAQISAIENGKRQPYPRNAKKLADALGVDIADILGGDPSHGLQATTLRRADVWDKSGGVCYYCGKELHPIRDFHVDHFVATSLGGSDEPDNLVASCRECNWDKRMEIDWPERREQMREQGIKITRVSSKRREDG